MPKKSVLITGITGQDGVFLTNLLLNKKENYTIYGTTRNKNSLNFFFNKLNSLGNNNLLDVKVQQVDLTNKNHVLDYLDSIDVSQVYNLSGPSSVYESLKKPSETQSEISSIFNNLINYFSSKKTFPNFFQASSSEMFGNNGNKIQDEKSKFSPNSPYANTKLDLHNEVTKLRQIYDWKIISGIMFNHESEFRSKNFLIMKIINYVKSGAYKNKKLVLGSIDYERDWSFAGDIVDCVYKLNEAGFKEDFVIGSGKGHKISYILNLIFDSKNLYWEEFVQIDSSLLRKGDPISLISNPSKLKQKINSNQTLSFEELINRCIKKS